MKDKENSLVETDTEELRKWRGMSQEEINQCWKNLAERIEEEVLDKYKVEESKREAFKGRGAPLEWRRVRGSKKYRIKEWRRRLLGKSLLFVQREKSTAFAKQAGGVGGRRRDEAAAKIDDYEGLTKKIRSKGRMDAENRWWITELNCWRQTVRKRGSIQDGKTPCRNGMSGWRR